MKALEAKKALQGILGVKQDGKVGIRTSDAFDRLSDAQDDSEWPPVVVAIPAGPGDPVDDRSEKAIATLHPKVQPLARQLVRDAAAHGIEIRVTSGTRTYAEQDELYKQGRSKPGKIVTNARAGHSWHNHGVAFDVTIFRSGTPVWESSQYAVVGALGKRLGLQWGGDWKGNLVDEPHFQLTNGKSLAEAISLHDEGKNVFS